MTSHRSSTSSSDLRRYVRVLAIALVVLVGGLVTVTATGYHLGLVEAANHEIYEYQRAKVDPQQTIDIAFVGDSSLGNAIDAALFTQLSGQTTVNLALNGSYGSGGAYNMARKVLEHHVPRLIIVMQSIDIGRRKEAFAGFYFSAEPAQLLTTSPVRVLELYFSLKTARRVVEHVWKFGLTAQATTFDGDYIQQGPADPSPEQEVAKNPLRTNMIAQAQIDYIGKLAQLCASHDAQCVYVYGPIFEGYCAQAQDYIDNMTAQIEAAGLDVVKGTPLCITPADVGDSVDHIRPGLKQEYTRRYFELLRVDIDRAVALSRGPG